MRLLLINPNTTNALTQRLAASVSAVLPQDATLIPTTAATGFPYISSRAEAQIAGADVLQTLAERQGEYDAAIIAAFGDPGLLAARELFDCPVMGMTESSMLMALSLGQNFAFVTFSQTLAPWYHEQVRLAGLEGRFGGIWTPTETMKNISDVADDLRAPLIDTCLRAAAKADVLILAGAPIAGLARDIAGDVPCTLIDPVQAAALQAVSHARLFPNGACHGSFTRPPGKPSTGLSTALSEWILGRPRRE
ncbi:aspartate/glutamate racemase family protein [Puniceibacterium sp. IMCC21224]|uniref:aspartate/glutamate racemase family protein n=1 Tax=Puniceibacterium sp. IMCC21224 TaxID=1618204 RepID=UPI00064E0135|nr:aspartate/glutamate racemase family protein [Puniceibacterium sp. IMCC21224]KMK68299.1 hydantoin racemase [Puniceibacterium sp. IMCC21224]